VVSWIASGSWVVLPPLWAFGLYRALRGQRVRVPWLTRHLENAPLSSPDAPVADAPAG